MQTLVGTSDMLRYFSELPIFIFCSQHGKTTENTYLKSFEQGSWLWISATTKKRDICPTAEGTEKLEWHLSHELSTSQLLSKQTFLSDHKLPLMSQQRLMTQHCTWKTSFSSLSAILQRKIF